MPEAELAQNIQGIGENLFKLKPTATLARSEGENVSFRWNHLGMRRVTNMHQNLISPLGLANQF